MPTLNLKSTSRQINAYYTTLEQLDLIEITNEFAVREPFQNLLTYCGRSFNWTLVPEYAMKTHQGNQIFVDSALIDQFRRAHGYCEAKGMGTDLPTEVQRKREQGYPCDNIIFQTPKRAILWQNDQQVLDADLTDPTQLVEVLQTFFAYRRPEYVAWEDAVAQFKDKVPALGTDLAEKIQDARETNREFITAFGDFHQKCCDAINPNLSEAAVEEMLIQHLLTERIFRTVFSNPDFTRRNVIAREIETVINALTSHAFSRDDFLQNLDRFYVAIERNAATIRDFSRKQEFLNTVYEQFFQGFSVKVADTHGIVYTPQPIVNFMVNSVEEILRTFDRSLSDKNVHIIDPFVGTGNFIVRIMQEIRRTALAHKYKYELHCNELMLLAYYIASMNIEHSYYEAMGMYEPFEGNCFADTFEDAERQQLRMFTPENTERVERQRQTDMFVIIGNPPYNMGQVNENDNNKNRKYPAMEKRVSETYTKDSKATLKNKLSDPYVKAIRWGSDRIKDEGVVVFVTNNSFLDGVAFDGMRQHLAEDFDEIYILDLGGNVRKNPKLSGTTHNVFGIQVGVSINFFIRRQNKRNSQAEIFYASVDEFWRKEEKYHYLNSKEHCGNIEWQQIMPDKRYTWLTEGLRAEFETFIPIGTKEAKAMKTEDGKAIFSLYSLGVVTSRDILAYSFNSKLLQERVHTFIEIYNNTVDRKRRHEPDAPVESFIDTNDPRIKWTRQVKASLKKLELSNYEDSHFRTSLYRPFNRKYLYFDNFWNEERYQQYRIFPTPETEAENRVICVSGLGSNKPFQTLMAGIIPSLDLLEKTQCFSFYTYDEDGTNRRENITDWALAQFRAHYGDDTITKWDIFHYVYGLLHHLDYRERYQANLKRDLPRLPCTPDFWAFAKAGQRLGEIHVGYEDVEEYPLDFVESPDVQLDWRVEKIQLSKDKTQLVYNEFLTLDGIPAKTYEYRLGNRSALEWVIDQYRVKEDKRSGIVNDPNRENDPMYIVKLIGKVIVVSLETVAIVERLPKLEVPVHDS